MDHRSVRPCSAGVVVQASRLPISPLFIAITFPYHPQPPRGTKFAALLATRTLSRQHLRRARPRTFVPPRAKRGGNGTKLLAPVGNALCGLPTTGRGSFLAMHARHKKLPRRNLEHNSFILNHLRPTRSSCVYASHSPKRMKPRPCRPDSLSRSGRGPVRAPSAAFAHFHQLVKVRHMRTLNTI
jgi:hypothetical protein